MRSRANNGKIGGVSSGIYNPNASAVNSLADTAKVFNNPSVSRSGGDPYRKYVTMHLGGVPFPDNCYTDHSGNGWHKYLSTNDYCDPALVTRYNQSVQYHSWCFFTGEWFTMPDSTALSLGSSTFAIEAWIYNTDNTTTAARIIAAKGSSLTNGWRFGLTAGNVLTFNHGGTAHNSPGTIPQATWTHVAVVRYGTGANQTTMYINGVATISFTCADTFNATTALYIGADQTNSAVATRWLGSITDFKITKGATNIGPITAPLTSDANTSVLWSMKDQFYDRTGWVTTTNNLPGRRPIAPFAEPSTDKTLAYWNNQDANKALTIFDNLQSTNTSLRFGTGAFTIEGWYFFNNFASYSIYSKGTASTGFEVAVAPYGSTGTIYLASDLVLTNVTANMLPWTWNHIAIQRSGIDTNQASIYVNGVSVWTGTIAGNFTGNDKLRIGTPKGTTGFTGTYALQGGFTNFRISNIARYSSTFTPQRTPLATDANTSLLILNSPNAGGFTHIDYGTSYGIFNGPNGIRAQGGSFSNGGYSYVERQADKVTLGLNTAVNFYGWDMTVECFYMMRYSMDNNLSRYIIDSRLDVNNSADTGFALKVSTGSAHAITFVVAGNKDLLTSKTKINGFTWYHICVQRVNNVFSLYINGVLEDSAYYTTGFNITDLKIAGNYNLAQGSRAAYGWVNNLRITRDARYADPSYTTGPPFITVPTTNLKKEDSGTNLVVLLGNEPMLRSNANLGAGTIYTQDGVNNAAINFGSPLPEPYDSAAHASNVARGGTGYSSSGNSFNDYEIHGSAASNWYKYIWLNLGKPSTIEGWFFTPYTSQVTPSEYTLMYTALSSGHTGFRLGINWNGTGTVFGNVYFQFIQGTTITTVSSATKTVQLNSWHHIAVVNNGSNLLSIFVNGVRVATSTTMNAKAPTTGVGRTSYALTVNAGATSLGEARISTTMRYDPSLTTCTIPTSTFVPDADTYTLLRPTHNIAETSGKAVVMTCGSAIMDTSVTKYCNASLALKNGNTAVQYDYLWFSSLPFNDAWLFDCRVSDYTLEGWVNWGGSTAPNASNTVMYFSNIYVTTNAAGRYIFSYGSWVVDSGVYPATGNNFDFIVVQRKNLNYCYYVNGVLVGTCAVGYTGSSNDRKEDSNTVNAYVQLGWDASGTRTWVGRYNDVRFTQGVARYDTRVINGVSTMVYKDNPTVPALPTGPLPTY